MFLSLFFLVIYGTISYHLRERYRRREISAGEDTWPGAERTIGRAVELPDLSSELFWLRDECICLIFSYVVESQ